MAIDRCTVRADGGASCWGINKEGALGDGTFNDSRALVNVLGLNSGVRQIGIGNGHSCALLDDGTVRCWGYNEVGQLGDGTTINSPIPLRVAL